MLGIDENPNIDIPSVTVTVSQPGADPAELETQVTKRIEDAVAGLGNIDEIISTVTDGLSTTEVNFVLGTNSDRATNDVRNAVAQIRQKPAAGHQRPDRPAGRHGKRWSHHYLCGCLNAAIGR